MDFPRIVGGEEHRIASRFGSLGFCISASISFASWLGALWVLLKGRDGKTEKEKCSLAARQGRQLQRYSSCGGRLVVGCIPYRLKMHASCTLNVDEGVQVLVISSQKGHGMMFPKGGWESDETMKQAASREALEEAGVHGLVESKLGRWTYKSKRYNVLYEGIMFPLNVTEELDCWPEKVVRKRRWVSIAEAREGCQHTWMREALDILVARLRQQHPIA